MGHSQTGAAMGVVSTARGWIVGTWQQESRETRNPVIDRRSAGGYIETSLLWSCWASVCPVSGGDDGKRGDDDGSAEKRIQEYFPMAFLLKLSFFMVNYGLLIHTRFSLINSFACPHIQPAPIQF
ncbi:uncharacterized protein LOC119285989 isoform X1 [Triticum dicoccoides]|uniref:uncharacterized protein LOC119285989 isoform X1 n=1 Tax=Triticum dicoccoides TaxID=85692 RepID=UPI0018903B4F|nr:uncharacterized protein LOC119285989 isoform X1 [Triticum dicoccoides]